MSAPSSVRAALRRLFATAAVAALLPLNATAQPMSASDHDRAYEAAQAEYEIGHYAAAFTAFASLADAGHAESARIAMQMHRHASGLYKQRFAAGPKQIERWTTLLWCRHQRVAATEACNSALVGEQRRAASPAGRTPCSAC